MAIGGNITTNAGVGFVGKKKKKTPAELAVAEAKAGRAHDVGKTKFAAGQARAREARVTAAGEKAGGRASRAAAVDIASKRKGADPAAIARFIEGGGGKTAGGGGVDSTRLNQSIRRKRAARFARGTAFNRTKNALDRTRITKNIKEGVNVPGIGFQPVGGEFKSFNPKIASRTFVPGPGGRPIRVPGTATSDEERADFGEAKRLQGMEGLRVDKKFGQEEVIGLQNFVNNLKQARADLIPEQAQAAKQSPGASAILTGPEGVAQQLAPTVEANLDQRRQLIGTSSTAPATKGFTASDRGLGAAIAEAQPDLDAAIARLAALEDPAAAQGVTDRSQQNLPLVIRSPEQTAAVPAAQQQVAQTLPTIPTGPTPGFAPGPGAPFDLARAQLQGTQGQLGATAPAGLPTPNEQILRDFAEARARDAAFFGALPGQAPQPQAPGQPPVAAGPPPPLAPQPGGGAGAGFLGTATPPPGQEARDVAAQAAARASDAQAGAVRQAAKQAEDETRETAVTAAMTVLNSETSRTHALTNLKAGLVAAAQISTDRLNAFIAEAMGSQMARSNPGWMDSLIRESLGQLNLPLPPTLGAPIPIGQGGSSPEAQRGPVTPPPSIEEKSGIPNLAPHGSLFGPIGARGPVGPPSSSGPTGSAGPPGVPSPFAGAAASAGPVPGVVGPGVGGGAGLSPDDLARAIELMQILRRQGLQGR